MADATPPKKGLTTFGWLLIGSAAAYVFSNKDRRAKVLEAAKGLAGKVTPGSADSTSA